MSFGDELREVNILVGESELVGKILDLILADDDFENFFDLYVGDALFDHYRTLWGAMETWTAEQCDEYYQKKGKLQGPWARKLLLKTLAELER